MKLLTLITYPDPFLRKIAQEINPQELPSLTNFFTSMIDIMHKYDGVGLAAPQIGKSIRCITVNYKNGPLIFINPALSHFSWRKRIAEEGCLSVPKVYGTVKRSLKVHYTALNESGKKVEGVAEGLFARILQHEIDHLNGILFIDRVISITHGNLKK